MKIKKNTNIIENRQENLDELSVKEINQILEHRQEFSHKVYKFVCYWSIFAASVCLLNGFRLLNFHLDNSVLVTLLTTTLAQILGLMYIVLKFIFPYNIDE